MKDNTILYIGAAIALYVLAKKQSVNSINGSKSYLFEYTYNGNVLTTAEFNAQNLKEAKKLADRYKRMELRDEFSHVPFNRIKTSHSL